MAAQWLVTEIGMGLSKLLCLRLPGHPPEDLAEGAVAAWIEALTFNRVWDQDRDRDRIRHAFRVLAASRTDWPMPMHLVEQLPPVPERLALPAKPVSPEVAEANLARIRELLAQPVHDFTPAPDPPEDRRPLAEVEAELSRHYSDRKTQAAGE
jgi:hypothetical protein